MRLFMQTLALVISALLAASAAQAKDGLQLTIAAYNIENAFDVFDDPYTADEGSQVKQRWALEAIAKSLARIDADIVVFSEVENQGVLRSIVTHFLADRGYDYLATIPTNDGRGINLGIISRYPIRSITSYRWQTLTLPGEQRTWRFARDLMHAQLVLPDDRTLHVFGVHFKSKRSSKNDDKSIKWRTAEAQRTRQIVTRLLKGRPDALVVVAGDFNSNPGDPAMNALLQSEPDTDGPPPLTDLHAGLSTQDRTTFPSTRYTNTIFDYILASPVLAQHVVPGSAGILKDPELTRGSDHLPVYATFRLPQ